MAESHINSGIAAKIKKLNQHKLALLKQIQDIDNQIHILTQAAKIMGEIDQLPKLRSQAFNSSVKTLVVQVLKQTDQPLSVQEIAKQAILLDNPAPTQENQSTTPTNKQLRAIRNSLSPLISDGVVDKIRLKRKEVKYLWIANQEKAEQ